MSAADDEPLVEFVAVNAAPAVTSPAAGPAGEPDGGEQAGDVVEHGARRASTRSRLLALAAAVTVGGALVVTISNHHGEPGGTAARAITRPNAASSVGVHAPTARRLSSTPSGTVPAPGEVIASATEHGSGELLAEQGAQRSLAAQLAKEQAARLASEQAAQIREAQQRYADAQRAHRPLGDFKLVWPKRAASCPAGALSCAASSGWLPPRVLAAVTSRIPRAEPVTGLELSEYADNKLYLRQIVATTTRCVIALHVLRTGSAEVDYNGQIVQHDSSSWQMFVQHPSATAGFAVRFRLAGSERACPSDAVLRSVALDPRLLATQP